MAGVKGQQHRGTNFNERQLAAEVRTLGLNETMYVLKNRKHKLYGPVLTRLAGTILPRLNHVSGEDGNPISITISATVAKKNGIDTSAG